ncbi:hypothetical protein CQY20_23470 [Mycolicibacterium agri]|uniref:Fenitrothion hydrolase n=1 Tax=Mycolicibacterium agri TaxID=36811 RepID=A0A2A7MUV4_MYCAG|nr:hypothetical protein [Mycolicibacterium agri]PEG34938.1 hypothetical protein CQY20_23470 [Mycolicibacterium agri]GFG53678.1 hypothetical protein MAGR_51190 [Mycolicibacterium agri]
MTDRPVTVLAHGLGGSTDLPIPYTYALIGAAWALTFTFAVVAFAWRRPRFDPDKPGRALPQWVTTVVDAPVTRWVVAAAGLAFAAWVAMAALFGPRDGNPLPGVFYVLLWVGLVAVSLAIGPVWRAVSPVRTVYRLLRLARLPSRDRYPRRLGYWPAVFGLFAFVWLELASPDPGSLGAIKLWLLIYLVVTLVGAIACGQRWFGRADPFEVYSVVASRFSVLRRNPQTGRIEIGNPFDHLPSLPVRPGAVTLLAVLLGSTAYDSYSAMPAFRNFVDRHTDSVASASTLHTAGLLFFIAVVVVTFWCAARATGGVDKDTRRKLPGLMAHSLIPIVLGYVFAHYLSYLVEKGQQTIIDLADPLGRGWNLLGLGDAEVSYILSLHPSVLATIKVGCVVAGHVGGVIAAHDRALRVLPTGYQLTGQLAMMLVMVGYTFTGLYLLFGG